MQDKLNAEVDNYNQIIQQINEAKAKLEELEAERLQRLGRINILSELIQESESATSNQVVSGEADDEATKSNNTQD